MQPGCAPRARHQLALTLVEVAMVIAILGVLAVVAIPAYVGHVERTRVQRAVAEIREIEFAVKHYRTDMGALPDSLDGLFDAAPVDPWGAPYEYLNLQSGDPGINGLRRRDKNMNPVNSDYDLYSMGPDGVTKPQFTAGDARDDIVRASDGDFVGVAEDY